MEGAKQSSLGREFQRPVASEAGDCGRRPFLYSHQWHLQWWRCWEKVLPGHYKPLSLATNLQGCRQGPPAAYPSTLPFICLLLAPSCLERKVSGCDIFWLQRQNTLFTRFSLSESKHTFPQAETNPFSETVGVLDFFLGCFFGSFHGLRQARSIRF